MCAWRPDKEVEIIVGTPPGGGQDRPARALMRVLETERLVSVPMRLANIPGKGGGNAWDALRQRSGDPHVLSISSAPLLTNRLLGVTDYDHAGLTPIANLYTEYLAFVARVDAGIRSGGAFLNALRKDPAALAVSIATALGTTNHIALGEIVQHVGQDPGRLRLRVFESALHAVADVVEGKSQIGVVSAASAVKDIEAGTLSVLAVSAPRRLGGCFAAAPTWSELSVPCTLGQWRGVIGAQAITEEQVAFWESALGAAVTRPAWESELARNYWLNTWKGAAATRDFLDGEREFLRRMLSDLGLLSR